MALNRPFGLSPIRAGTDAAFNAQLVKYRIPSTDPSQYSINDPLRQAAGADANGVPNVQKHTGTLLARGILCGVENPSINTPSLVGNALQPIITIPAVKSQDYYVLVCDDQNVVFTVQDDGITTGNLVAASANLNSSLTIANPAQPYQVSAVVLLSSSFLANAALCVKLMGLAQIPAIPGGGSNAFGAYAVWVARWNQHEFMGNQAGI